MVDQQYDTLFLGYIEGDLTLEQILEFENMLVQDARLRNLVAQLVIDRSRMRRLPREDAPPELMDRVNQQIERRMLLNGSLNPPAPAGMSPERRFHLNRYMAYAGLAAMVAITAMVVVWTLSNPAVQDLAHKPARPQTLAESQAKIEGGQLADGRVGRDQGDLLRGRQLDETEARPRELAKPLARGPRPIDRPVDSENETSDSLAGLGESKRESSQTGLPTPSATAAPALTDRNAFSENKKQLPSAAAAPAAESATAGGRMDAKSALADKDLKIPSGSGSPAVPVFYEAGGIRLEVASAWPDVSRREVLAWATRHNAEVVPPADNSTDASNAQRIEKTTLQKSTGETPADRTVVIMVANKQVPDLVAFLNTQKGQSATLTQPVAVDGTAMAAHHEQAQWRSNSEPGAARGERAATQPATMPAEASARKSGGVSEENLDEEQVQLKRVKVPPEIVVVPSAPDAVMRLEVIIEPRGADR